MSRMVSVARSRRFAVYETEGVVQQKFQTRAFEQVAPILQPGEQPVVATRAMVGKFGSGRFGAIVKRSAILGHD